MGTFYFEGPFAPILAEAHEPLWMFPRANADQAVVGVLTKDLLDGGYAVWSKTISQGEAVATLVVSAGSDVVVFRLSATEALRVAAEQRLNQLYGRDDAVYVGIEYPDVEHDEPNVTDAIVADLVTLGEQDRLPRRWQNILRHGTEFDVEIRVRMEAVASEIQIGDHDGVSRVFEEVTDRSARDPWEFCELPRWSTVEYPNQSVALNRNPYVLALAALHPDSSPELSRMYVHANDSRVRELWASRK
jgi:hypothetical protein